MRFKELTPTDIAEIVNLSAAMDSDEERTIEFGASDIGGPEWVAWEEASEKLVSRIDALSDVARAELTLWLGSAGGILTVALMR